MKENSDLKKTLFGICILLKENINHYDWVGFYIADESKKELMLGPYAGVPTEHVKIPYGKGICGQVAERKQPMIIQDVSRENNYLSCSISVKSEIVIPVFKNNIFIAELDIDSHTISPFTEEDCKFLEKLCSDIANLF